MPGLLAGFLGIGGLAEAGPLADRCLSLEASLKPEATVAACNPAFSEELSTVLQVEVLIQRGVALRSLGRYDAAIADLERALTLAPGNADGLRMLAWTERERGNLAVAEAIYTRVLTVDDHWQGWLSRCVVRLDLDRPKDAVNDCREAEARDPGNPDTAYFFARSLNELGTHDEAARVARRAAAAADAPPRIFDELVRAEVALGNRDAARTVLEEGLRRYPENLGLRRLLAVLGE
ncbi:MAG: tetratricopeptide repeat protein [Pseudomonadota bacterium]